MHFFLLFSNPQVAYNVSSFPDDLTYISLMQQRRQRLDWFDPTDHIPIQAIWPDSNVTAATGTTSPTLSLTWSNHCTSVDSAWGGIMRRIHGFNDLSNIEFMELWVRGRKGQLNIDLGNFNDGTQPGSGGTSITGNDYITYRFNLNPLADTTFISEATYFDDGTPTGWVLYRIPISDYSDTIGTPDITFKNITSIRLWLNYIPPTPTVDIDTLQIAAFDFIDANNRRY